LLRKNLIIKLGFSRNERLLVIRWSTAFLNDVPAELLNQPVYCVLQINNVMNNPVVAGQDRWVAYLRPQIVAQFFNGRTGRLLYAEAVAAMHDKSRNLP
jgi:alkaline phosphatase D